MTDHFPIIELPIIHTTYLYICRYYLHSYVSIEMEYISHQPRYSPNRCSAALLPSVSMFSSVLRMPHPSLMVGPELINQPTAFLMSRVSSLGAWSFTSTINHQPSAHQHISTALVPRKASKCLDAAVLGRLAGLTMEVCGRARVRGSGHGGQILVRAHWWRRAD